MKKWKSYNGQVLLSVRVFTKFDKALKCEYNINCEAEISYFCIINLAFINSKDEKNLKYNIF